LGASGFVSKNIPSADLIEAVNSVQRGNTFMCGKTVKMLIEYKGGEGLKKSLTKREIEVLNLVARGLSTREIADKLFTSEHTIRKHRENINAKLNVHSGVEATVFAINAGLILPLESYISIRPEFG
jgi:DNA-binding NarL/FixJ family response regulator